MSECIFCKIARGEIQCHKIYEDDKVIAFLDVNPVSSGHSLVIPKNHFENIFDASEEVLERINVVCKKIALKIKNNLGAKGINIVSASGKAAQQSVFHIHYHVIPRDDKDGLDLWFHGRAKIDNLSEIAEKLRR